MLNCALPAVKSKVASVMRTPSGSSTARTPFRLSSSTNEVDQGLLIAATTGGGGSTLVILAINWSAWYRSRMKYAMNKTTGALRANTYQKNFARSGAGAAVTAF